MPDAGIVAGRWRVGRWGRGFGGGALAGARGSGMAVSASASMSGTMPRQGHRTGNSGPAAARHRHHWSSLLQPALAAAVRAMAGPGKRRARVRWRGPRFNRSRQSAEAAGAGVGWSAGNLHIRRAGIAGAVVRGPLGETG